MYLVIFCLTSGPTAGLAFRYLFTDAFYGFLNLSVHEVKVQRTKKYSSNAAEPT